MFEQTQAHMCTEGFLQGSWVPAAQTAQSTALPCLKASFVSCSCGPARKFFPSFIPLTITKPILVFILSWIYSHLLPKCFPVLSSFSTRACWCLPQLTPEYSWRTIPSLLSPQLNTSGVACVCLGQHWTASARAASGLWRECTPIIPCPCPFPLKFCL